MDMTQEVFVRALGRPLPALSEASARRWLLRVATNLSLNELRRRKYWKSSEARETAMSGSTILDRMVEDRDLVRQVMTRAAPENAAAAVGYLIEGKTAAEIAAELKTSVPTVRRRIRRFLETAEKVLGGAS